MTRQRLVQLVHIARNELGVDEDTYHRMLQGLTGKAPTKGMGTTQLSCVLESMKRKSFYVKPAGKASSGLPLDNHLQSGKTRALWLEAVAAGIVRDHLENALARWIKRETGISILR